MTTEAIVKRRYLQSGASRSTNNTTITEYLDDRLIGGEIGDGNAAFAVSYSTGVDRLYADLSSEGGLPEPPEPHGTDTRDYVLRVQRTGSNLSDTWHQLQDSAWTSGWLDFSNETFTNDVAIIEHVHGLGQIPVSVHTMIRGTGGSDPGHWSANSPLLIPPTTSYTPTAASNRDRRRTMSLTSSSVKWVFGKYVDIIREDGSAVTGPDMSSSTDNWQYLIRLSLI